jgi:hypothetical protein
MSKAEQSKSMERKPIKAESNKQAQPDNRNKNSSKGEKKGEKKQHDAQKQMPYSTPPLVPRYQFTNDTDKPYPPNQTNQPPAEPRLTKTNIQKPSQER